MWVYSREISLSPSELIGKRIQVQNLEGGSVIGTITDGCPEKELYYVTLEKGGEVTQVQLTEGRRWWLWDEQTEGDEANSKAGSNEKNLHSKNNPQNSNGEVAQQTYLFNLAQVKEEMEEVSAVGGGTEKYGFRERENSLFVRGQQPNSRQQLDMLLSYLNNTPSFYNQDNNLKRKCCITKSVGGGNNYSSGSVSKDLVSSHSQFNEYPYKKRILSERRQQFSNNANNTAVRLIQDLRMIANLNDRQDEHPFHKGGVDGGGVSCQILPLLHALSQQHMMGDGSSISSSSSSDRIDQLDSIVNQLKEASSNKVVGECLTHISKLEKECALLMTTCEELEGRCRLMEQRMLDMQSRHQKELEGLEFRLKQYRNCLACIQKGHQTARNTVNEAE
eukprot:TRINITY_DN17058_c0_g2_i2.p1 TRINITY_DN17058_c0_g2~~TRINITY_DN17058_c0_g2_i2.p1  ORF type:complete len:391 (-),score=61.95 TRINITY_DN17058_c0_g2_i2:490-1662(-)